MIWVNDIPSLEPGDVEYTMVRHRDVQTTSVCGGQIGFNAARELFHVDYWCVYCGLKWNAETPTERFPDYGYQGDVTPL